MTKYREGTENYKSSLEHLIVPESYESLKKQKDGTHQEDMGTNRKEFSMAKPGTIIITERIIHYLIITQNTK